MKKSFLFFLSVSLFFVVLIMVGCGGKKATQSAPTVLDYINSGMQKYTNKDYASAIQDYGQAQTLSPTTEQQKDIYCYMGWAYFQSNDNSNALSYFNQSINLLPDYNCLSGKIFVLMTDPKTLNLQEALNLSLTLLADKPNFLLSFFPNIKALDIQANVALIYFLLEDYTNAQKYVNLVLSLDGQNSLALTIQGEIQKRTK